MKCWPGFTQSSLSTGLVEGVAIQMISAALVAAAQLFSHSLSFSRVNSSNFTSLMRVWRVVAVSALKILPVSILVLIFLLSASASSSAFVG